MPKIKNISVSLGLILTGAAIPLPVLAQSFGEFGGVHAGAAGLGAGLAASQNKGALVRNTYAVAAQGQEAVAAQTNAIKLYLAAGQAYESKKQWAEAEKAFTYVLQVVCKRDGPGSQASLPALKHLASISREQNKIDQAIGFQKTVVAFTHCVPKIDNTALLKVEDELTDLYILKGDYPKAEPVVRDQVSIIASSPQLPPEKQHATLKTYSKVLRQLHKNAQADAIEASLAAGRSPVDVAATAKAAAEAADAAALAEADGSTTNAPISADAPGTAISTPPPAAPAAPAPAPGDLAPAPVEAAAGSSSSNVESSKSAITDQSPKNAVQTK